MDTMTPEEVATWNRAALKAGGLTPSEGDRALCAMLLAHGLVMNCGVLHAVECLSSSELEAAIAGYRFFGLTAVAELLGNVGGADSARPEVDSAYGVLIPNDSRLREVFIRHFNLHREQYTPIG